MNNSSPDCTKSNKEQLKSGYPLKRLIYTLGPAMSGMRKGIKQKKKTHGRRKIEAHREYTRGTYFCTDVNLNKYALCIIKKRRTEHPRITTQRE